MVFMLNGCLGSKAPITCSELSNDYHRYNIVKDNIILDVAKDYQALAKYIFIYDNTSQFNKDIDTYFLYLELFKKKSIDKPFINKYCNSINFTIKDENISKVSNELNKIKEKWTHDYNENIENNLKNKVKFNEIDGCEKMASQLVEYIVTFQIKGQNKNSHEIYIEMKEEYNKCLSIYKKRGKK
jgi:hypothetical protein